MRLIYHTCLCLFLVACFFNVATSQNLDNAGLPSSSAAGAYSLRLLSSTYTGPLVRITIASNYYDVYPDTTTHGFSLASKISASLSTYNAAVSVPTTSALSTIIPSMTATVAVWYDQSSSNNAIQSTTGNQPRIINSGIIETNNSLPTIRYLGNTFLVVTSTAFNNDLSGTVVFNATSVNTSSGSAGSWYNMNGIFGSEQGGGVNDFGYGVYNGKFTAGSGSSDNSVAGSATVNNSTTRIHSWTRNNATGAVNIYANGASEGSMTLNTGTRSNVPSVAIGANQTFSGGQVFYTGTISEMILMASIYNTTNRNALENNQSNYYTTSVATNANLTALTISEGVLSPAFATDTIAYTSSVPNTKTNIIVTPTKSDVNATIQVQINGGGYSTVISGSASSSLSLNEGSNTLDVKVTASNGTTIKTYTTTITRAASSPTNADLVDLTISAGFLTPSFSTGTLAYSAPNIPNTTTSVTITPTKSDYNSVIQVRVNSGSYSDITSGSTSADLALDEGSNTIDVQVTAQDGTTIKTYTITIVRAATSPTNADLSNLNISTGVLSPTFNPSTLTYSSSVSNSTTSITVTPTKSDLNATIQVRINGDSYVDLASGSTSSALALNIGTNTIDIKVTAQDGTTINTYSIIVCRLPTASIASTNGPVCSGNNAIFNIVGTSGATLTYNINSGANATTTLTGGTATITISSVSVNQIINLVSITDGMCTQTLGENATIIVNTTPTPSVSGATTACSSVSLTASGGATYAWSSGTTPSTAANSFTTSGSYTVTVTGSNGCAASTTTSITVNTPASVVYVNGAVSVSGDGSSWANAFKTLQEALTTCTQQIWVTAGTYKPTAYPTGCTSCSSSRDYTFHLVNGVKLYGGFDGTETLLSQRNYVTNVTILSGDFNGNDAISGSGTTLSITNNTENAYHVVMSVSDNSTTVLDGFTITGGYANSGVAVTVETKSITRTIGGGIVNMSSSPSLCNIIFTGNWGNSGGGNYNGTSSSPTITYSTFKLNKATNGGSMYNTSSSSPNITKSIFNGNLATSNGGGLFNTSSSSPTITNTVFVGNKGSNGGGIYNQSTSNPSITNVVFNSNIATNGGGMYNVISSSPTIINCTFNGNSATTNGAGVNNNSSSSPIIKNSIIWGNTGGGTQGIYNASGTPTVTYSIVQGSSTYSGTGNLLSDPLFLNTSDPNGTDNIWRTADDGLSVQRSSPAINAGTNSGAPSTDITDSTRISTADMGAYENVSDNANLSSLTISAGTLSPVFTSDSLRYSATVTNASSTITVTPTVAESSAIVVVKINSGSYATVTSGSASEALALDEGINTINVKVTAQDGATIKIDTITVCRSVAPSVSVAITAGSATICTGNSVTFTATPTNGGTPTYQWKKGNSNIDSETNATYTSTSLADNDSINVVMTSTASCRTNDTAISSDIKMTVNTVCTFTWTGATSSDWTTPTNWTPNGVPASTDDVIIPSTTNEPMLPSGQIIKNLNLTGENKIMLGNNNLCVNSITGGSSTAYVVIDGTGSLTVKSLSTSAPTIFPIGMSETSYDSLSIQPSSSADFTIKVKNTPTAGDFNGSIADFSKVVHRQWEITPSGGSPGSTVLTFTNGGATFVPTTPVVGHFTSSNAWEELPATYHDGVWTATTTSFSPFSVGQAGGFVPSTPLPIELLSFKAENSGTDNILKWSTATEQNSQYFEIQHSLNGIDFKKMDRITATGESSMTKNYNYTHLNPASTTHYYRLKMVDRDDAFKYSLIVSVNNLDNNSTEPISLYPNPTKDNLTIAAPDYTHAMQLYNANGKLVASSNTTPNEIDMSKLQTGVYFLHIGKDVLKVIKQ